MPIFGRGRVHADPKTESQLRQALSNSQSRDDEFAADIAELQSDVAALESVAGAVTAVFDSTAEIGQPVYVASAGHVDLANASATGTSGVIGLVFTAATAGNNGEYITGGRLTQSDWTTVIGAANLAAGSLYFLNTTDGTLSATAPSTRGQTVVRVGRALTATTLHVEIEPGVLL